MTPAFTKVLAWTAGYATGRDGDGTEDPPPGLTQIEIIAWGRGFDAGRLDAPRELMVYVTDDEPKPDPHRREAADLVLAARLGEFDPANPQGASMTATPQDLAWAAGYALGRQGYAWREPPVGLTQPECTAWEQGHMAGTDDAFEESQARNAAGPRDLDPFSTSPRSCLAGHPAFEPGGPD